MVAVSGTQLKLVPLDEVLGVEKQIDLEVYRLAEDLAR
jgi:hypothetical protein